MRMTRMLACLRSPGGPVQQGRSAQGPLATAEETAAAASSRWVVSVLRGAGGVGQAQEMTDLWDATPGRRVSELARGTQWLGMCAGTWYLQQQSQER